MQITHNKTIKELKHTVDVQEFGDERHNVPTK